jgi:hypothetical protein
VIRIPNFFHLRASQRRRKNRIVKLKRPDGSTTDCLREMGNLTNSFYKELYRSEGTANMEEVLATVPVKVTEEMNAQLGCVWIHFQMAKGQMVKFLLLSRQMFGR